MTLSEPSPEVTAAFDTWIKEEILKLSVDALKLKALTCTACGEVLGAYIIEYEGTRFRYSAERTYAFLHYILSTSVVEQH
jgi:hypothetical protein